MKFWEPLGDRRERASASPHVRVGTTGKRHRGRTGAVLGVALLPAVLVGASASAAPRPPESSSTTTITLYNGQHQQTTDSLVQSFESEYPNIKVNVRNDDEDVLADEIVQEGARSPADVFYTENSPALQFLAQKGLLSTVDRSTLNETAAKYSSPTGRWVGVSARVSVLIYNPKVIKKSALPTKVLQLADPRYKGLLAMAPGETDFQPIVTSVLATYGRAKTLAWLNGMKANAAGHIYPDNETISSQVNRGQAGFGIINQYYWFRMQAQIGRSNIDSAIAYFANGDPGYVLDVSAAGVLESSKHQVAAQEFLAFLDSRRGQEIIAHSISYEYPIASGVVTGQPEVPLADLHPNRIDLAQLGTGAAAIALLQESQLL